MKKINKCLAKTVCDLPCENYPDKDTFFCRHHTHYYEDKLKEFNSLEKELKELSLKIKKSK